MKLKLILYLLCLPLFIGCNQTDDLILSSTMPEVVSSISEEPSAQLQAIRNYIHKNHSLNTRSVEESIIPYMIENDTLLYIANYQDGWEVFSNDLRQPMVLMKSDTGFFYPNVLKTGSPLDSFFYASAEHLQQLKKQGISDDDLIDDSWIAFGLHSPQIEYVNLNSSDEDIYDWVWVASTVGTSDTYTLTPKGGRLTTKWEQRNNFNLFTPFLSDSPSLHAAAGCIPIAFGQFFFHSNKYFNKPTQAPCKATYNESSNTYSFSNMSADIWNDLNYGDSFINTPLSMESTASMIGWIGKEIGISYEKKYDEGSGTGITEKVISFFKSQTGLSAISLDFDNNACQSILTKGYPVIIFLNGIGTGNHCALLDYYIRYHHECTDFYVYKKIHGDDIDIDETPDIPAEPTVDELERIFGKANVRCEHSYYNDEYYRLNWGAGGSHNDVSFAANFDIWSLSSGDKFKKNKIFSF